MSSFKFKLGGKTMGTYAGKETIKIVGPVVLRDGDEVEAEDSADNDEASWCINHYPSNFSIVE